MKFSMLRLNLGLAINSIRNARLRTVLTVIAVMIGVMSYVSVTTTVNGLKNSVSDQIRSIGDNAITVVPGNALNESEDGSAESLNLLGSLGSSSLSIKDLEDIKALDGVIAAAPQSIITGTVSREDNELDSSFFIIATNGDYPVSLSQNVENGTFFEDDETTGNVVVVGTNVVEELFAGTVSLGSSINIRGDSFTIIGVMEEFDTQGIDLGVNVNNAVLIPYSKASEYTGGDPQILQLSIQVDEGADVNEMVALIKQTLMDNHGGQEDFSVLTQDELVELSDNVFDLVRSASQWISYVMLFIGGIVIMLIMLMTVTERTREIGIRKSIGATNSNILSQFMIEAIVLTWLGAFYGILFSFLLGLLTAALVNITPSYTTSTFLAVFFITSVIGVVAGILPAMRAARKDPIEALRHE